MALKVSMDALSESPGRMRSSAADTGIASPAERKTLQGAPCCGATARAEGAAGVGAVAADTGAVSSRHGWSCDLRSKSLPFHFGSSAQLESSQARAVKTLPLSCILDSVTVARYHFVSFLPVSKHISMRVPSGRGSKPALMTIGAGGGAGGAASTSGA